MRRAIVIAIALLLQASGVARAQEVTVAAAISLKESLTQCAAEFEKDSKTHIRFSFGGSGELATQIEQGAPIDLFISAAQDQIDQLAKAKVVEPSSHVIVARNRLVLIVPALAKNPPAGFDELQDGSKVTRIAIGNPKTVPAGKYASQVISRLKQMNKQRLIYAMNVRQVLDYVERGEVSAGIVYQTDALANTKVKVVATADESLHDPIVYPAVVIKNGANATAAGEFLKFLQSERAQKIFEGNGFPPTTQPTK
ncbi:MAG: molybdate ABC transporter substrate-binding protein [Anaerolineae bacterium]|nr:molybdate ABC transporter substrate-binding protein [Phycisphaerae bacterium]